MENVTGDQSQYVVLVDENDNPLGVEEKLKAHQNGGRLHRAFSVFILDESGKILIHQRSESKYHCPNLWSNACCSHPQLREHIQDSARKRLSVELGFTTELFSISNCTYCLPLENGLTEWEFDHILVGHYSGDMYPNPEEAKAIRWLDFNTLQKDLVDQPDIFAPWLFEIFPFFSDWYHQDMTKKKIYFCCD